MENWQKISFSYHQIPCLPVLLSLENLSWKLRAGLEFGFLVNLASYTEPWADIQVSTISLVNLASYLEPWTDIQVSTTSLVNLACYLEPLGWYSSLIHISCKLGQLSRALGWYSSLNHISCKLGQLSRALGWYSSLNHMPWQTVQTQMSNLIRVYTVWHSVCMVWTLFYGRAT